MKIGDVVTVRSTGRHARIVDERGSGYFGIEYIPEPSGDPMDREMASSGEPGIYRERDLEVAE